jgi:spore maturation protein CgeB
MGHEVLTTGFVRHTSLGSLPRYALRVLGERLRGDRPARADRRLLKLARAFKPDLLLATTVMLHPAILEELGRLCPGRRVLWWGDPPSYSVRWGILDPGWDWVYLKDKSAVQKLRIAGRNAFLLHEAMNPRWHRPVAERRNGGLAVAGNYYAYRQAVVQRLLNDGVAVDLFGPAPPRWGAREIKALHSGRYVMREEKSRVFGEALGCLNTFQVAEGNALNCRAFEIAGAGGLQLIEDRPAVEDCFERGREILAFGSYEELLDHVERARRHPAEMTAIREAGARRAFAEHTYRHRLERILAALP